jgi:ABC-type multidrug transport system ATPase subunit
LQAVEKTSFVVQKGEILGIIGPNGAGKTSLFEMLTMNKKRSLGDVKLMNVPITSSKLKQKDLGPKIGIVNQSNSIWHEMTVY